MADIVSPEKRSLMMSGIKGKNTKPELAIRKALHHKGFRYRLHDKNLPGKPDLVFPKYRAVVFINGCFWHGHNCQLFKWPESRADFWKKKIGKNQVNDTKYIETLISSDWRVAVIWECSIRGSGRLDFEKVTDLCAKWLVSKRKLFEIRGIYE